MTKSGADQIGGADYTSRLHRQRIMVMALEACHRGWGMSVIIGVAGAGWGDRHAAVPAGDRPGRERYCLWRRARVRTDVPKIVDWYMEKKIQIDLDDHPHHAAQRSTRLRP
jgi:S-(hydroxymethyl)glutathione dehydrogenase/alcohol dehydrogenase